MIYINTKRLYFKCLDYFVSYFLMMKLFITTSGAVYSEIQHNQESTKPLFQFGIFADAQFANKNTVGKRNYSLGDDKLKECIAELNQQQIEFNVNLGDLIDGNGFNSLKELKQMLTICQESRAPIKHVIGNHCLEVDENSLLRELGLTESYYAFSYSGWLFVILNSMEVSIKSPHNSVRSQEAKKINEKIRGLPSYNGALGKKQIAWLKDQLEGAEHTKAKVVIFCHQPVHVAASNVAHILWDSQEVLNLLNQYTAVKVWMNGHDHAGGYTFDKGIHHITFPGMVETVPGNNCYAIVQVFSDRLKIEGRGTMRSMNLLCQ